jgi:UDP-N-acetylglucosamine transferase subunit ALG13
VITYDDLGSTFELLRSNKPMIGVSNDLIPDKHQQELLQKIAWEGYLLCCEDLPKWEEYIEISRSFTFKQYQASPCSMSSVIVDFLKKQL